MVNQAYLSKLGCISLKVKIEFQSVMQLLAGTLELKGTPFEQQIWNFFSEKLISEEGVLGYQTPTLSIRDVNEIPSFIVRSRKHGIMIFNIIDDKIISISEDDDFWLAKESGYIYSPDVVVSKYYQNLLARLSDDSKLFNRKKNTLNFEIKRYIIFAANMSHEIISILDGSDFFTCEALYVDDWKARLEEILVDETNKISSEMLDLVDSLIEGTDIYKKTKKQKIPLEPQTINDYIKISLDHTWKLDNIQRSVALQIPSGPQRIRGLAGTGKTIILCMKAANAHKIFSDYKILFVFNTLSMYPQIEKHISDYYTWETKTPFNKENLNIRHAWGGKNVRGLYSEICEDLGIRPKTFYDVRHLSDPNTAIFEDLLKLHKNDITPKYDLVLIDEAQDFSPAFFEVIYLLTKEEKRIVWAYDEFQSLKELQIREPENLFGSKEDGTPNMPNSVLEGEYTGSIRKDFVLPNSYRNPKINLLIAHGIGLVRWSGLAAH